MTEQERMLSGKLYFAGDETLAAARARAHELCWKYNNAHPNAWEERDAILKQLLGSMGKDCYIEPSFRCDYGSQIHLGDNFYANYDCIFLDVAPITIGSRAYFAPRVCLYTAGHPTVPEVRNLDLEFGLPITIGDNVWIGGNSIVLPGVTIGSNTIIAAGSIVTKDIPSGVIAGGNPCRVLRPLDGSDRAKWEAQRLEYERDRHSGPQKTE